MWYGNTPIHSDSPFIVKYRDEDYQKILETQNQEQQALNDYWVAQPELKEPGFLAQLQEAIDREKNDPTQRVMHIWELAKYRLRNRIPSTLPFEERKRLLLNSEEWHGRINQTNKHLAAKEITEDNINAEIDSVAIRWGMEIEHQYQRLSWLSSALNGKICEVYIG